MTVTKTSDDRCARCVQVSPASIEAKGPPRCPACFLVQGVPLRGFSCTLTRCPRTFIDIQPSNKVEPAGALDLGD